MENTILIMLIVIALLICAIAGLIIKISGQAQKIKGLERVNRTLYVDYKTATEQNEKLVGDNIELKNKIRANEVFKKVVKTPTTADYKKQIIKDYKAGAGVHDIATKYCLKSNTVFKAIQRWKAKGDI